MNLDQFRDPMIRHPRDRTYDTDPTGEEAVANVLIVQIKAEAKRQRALDRLILFERRQKWRAALVEQGDPHKVQPLPNSGDAIQEGGGPLDAHS